MVLEGRPVDAGPRDPLGGEADHDQGQGQAAPPVGHDAHEQESRHAQPPDHEVAGVVDGGRRPGPEALLVEPDGLEVERPRPPRRRRGVGRREAVVVAVHLAGQVEERLAGVARRPAGDELVVLDHGPRDVRDDVDRDRQHGQTDGHPDDRQAKEPARPQPALGRRRRRFQAVGRLVRSRRRRQRPEAQPTTQGERHQHGQRTEPEHDGHPQRREREAPDDQLGVGPPERHRTEEDERAEGRGRDHGEAHLLVGPGDRMEDGDDDRGERQGDHDEQEREVAEALPLGHAHGHVAEHAGQRDEPEDRDDPPEGAPDEDQQGDPADRVERDPLARQGEPEQRADERHPHPERRPSAPPARPDGGEDRVGRDDEGADVDVVHADPGLDEEHPVGDDEDRDEPGDEPAPEEDPREQVQAGGRQRPEDDAGHPPGERVRAELDRRERPVGIEDEQLLAVGRRVVGLDVGRPGDRREPVGQARVREDRTPVRLPTPVRLDDIDRPRAGRVGTRGRDGRVRSEPEDVDHLARVVVHDLRARPRERMAAPVDRAVLGVVAPDREDVVGRRRRGAGRREQLRVLQPGHLGEAVRAALHPDRGDDLDAGRVDERDAVARSRPRSARRPGSRSRAGARRRSRSRSCRASRWCRRSRGRPSASIAARFASYSAASPPSSSASSAASAAGSSSSSVFATSVEPLPPSARSARPGQVERARRCAGHEVEGLEVVARADHDGRAVLRDVQQVHGRADLAEVDGRHAGRRGIRADGGETERRDASVVEAGHELLAARVDRQRADARRRDRRDQLAAAQVVAADLRPGRDVEAFARAAARQGRVIAARLDDRGTHRHAEVAGGADVVLAPGHDAERHRVLGQVRVGPLVDVVRQPVPPVLEELRGRPRVVDLVEVHLVRLGQPERPERQARDDQDREDPQVQAVEATAALAAQRGTPIRADGSLAETVAEPADHAALGDAERPRPGRHRRGRDRRTGRDGRRRPRRRRRPGRWTAPRRRAGAATSVPARVHGRPVAAREPSSTTGSIDPGLDRGTIQLIGQPIACARPELERAPDERERVEQDDEGHAGLGADRRSDPQPVADRWVVRVQRREDDVHVREGRHAQDHVRDPPARRDGGEDDAEREERVAVPLVDPGREDEEREREHGQPDEEREPVGFASDRPQDEEERPDEQGDPDRDRRDDPEDGAPGPALLGAQGRVADPLAGRGEAGARVREDAAPTGCRR